VIVVTTGVPVGLKVTNIMPAKSILPVDPTLVDPVMSAESGGRTDRIFSSLAGGLGPRIRSVNHASSVNQAGQESLAGPGEPIRVFVAESSRMAGELIEEAVRRNQQRFEVHSLSIKLIGPISRIRKCKPQVALLSSDLRDGPLTGFRVLLQLRQAHRKVRSSCCSIQTTVIW